MVRRRPLRLHRRLYPAGRIVIFGFSISDIFFVGGFSFGVGYAIGHARNFGCFKFAIALIALFPFYMAFIESPRHFALSIGAFLCGLFSVFISGVGGPSLQFPFRRFIWNLRQRNPLKEDFSEGRKPEESKGPRSGPDRGGGSSAFDEERRRREEAEEMRKRDREKAKASASSRDKGARSGEAPPKDDIASTKDIDNRTAYEILGLQSGASRDEIVKAYREKVKALHPDRWIQMPPHLRKELEEEMKKINGAYKRLSG